MVFDHEVEVDTYLVIDNGISEMTGPVPCCGGGSYVST